MLSSVNSGLDPRKELGTLWVAGEVSQGEGTAWGNPVMIYLGIALYSKLSLWAFI